MSTASVPKKVYIVIREFPDISTEIERVFLDEDLAHEYIADRYPFFSYYREHDYYAMPELTEDELLTEERYYVLIKDIDTAL